MASAVKFAAKNFFDKGPVVAAVGKARARVLGRQGALVRKIARNSMKKRKKESPPGMPPRVVMGQIKDFLYFGYDQTTKTMVVGPIKLSGSKSKGTALTNLEFGGSVKTAYLVGPDGTLVPLNFLSKASRRAARQELKMIFKPSKIETRPFMIPALEKAKPMLAKMWTDQVKK